MCTLVCLQFHFWKIAFEFSVSWIHLKHVHIHASHPHIHYRLPPHRARITIATLLLLILWTKEFPWHRKWNMTELQNKKETVHFYSCFSCLKLIFWNNLLKFGVIVRSGPQMISNPMLKCGDSCVNSWPILQAATSAERHDTLDDPVVVGDLHQRLPRVPVACVLGINTTSTDLRVSDGDSQLTVFRVACVEVDDGQIDFLLCGALTFWKKKWKWSGSGARAIKGCHTVKSASPTNGNKLLGRNASRCVQCRRQAYRFDIIGVSDVTIHSD